MFKISAKVLGVVMILLCLSTCTAKTSKILEAMGEILINSMISAMHSLFIFNFPSKSLTFMCLIHYAQPRIKFFLFSCSLRILYHTESIMSMTFSKNLKIFSSLWLIDILNFHDKLVLNSYNYTKYE